MTMLDEEQTTPKPAARKMPRTAPVPTGYAPSGPDHSQDAYSVQTSPGHYTTYDPRAQAKRQSELDRADVEKAKLDAVNKGFQSHLAEKYGGIHTAAGDALDALASSVGLSRLKAGDPTGINKQLVDAAEDDNKLRQRILGQVRQKYVENPTFTDPGQRNDYQAAAPIGPTRSGQPMGPSLPQNNASTTEQSYNAAQSALQRRMSLPQNEVFTNQMGGMVAGNNETQSRANLNNSGVGLNDATAKEKLGLLTPRVNGMNAETDFTKAKTQSYPGQVESENALRGSQGKALERFGSNGGRMEYDGQKPTNQPATGAETPQEKKARYAEAEVQRQTEAYGKGLADDITTDELKAMYPKARQNGSATPQPTQGGAATQTSGNTQTTPTTTTSGKPITDLNIPPQSLAPQAQPVAPQTPQPYDPASNIGVAPPPPELHSDVVAMGMQPTRIPGLYINPQNGKVYIVNQQTNALDPVA